MRASKRKSKGPLSPAAVRRALARLPGWRLARRGRRSELRRRYRFPGGRKGFLGAIRFMGEAARAIDRMNHHPTWTNAWVTLDVRLSTHDAGDRVTGLDVRLAERLERLFRKRVGEGERA